MEKPFFTKAWESLKSEYYDLATLGTSSTTLTQTGTIGKIGGYPTECSILTLLSVIKENT